MSFSTLKSTKINSLKVKDFATKNLTVSNLLVQDDDDVTIKADSKKASYLWLNADKDNLPASETSHGRVYFAQDGCAVLNTCGTCDPTNSVGEDDLVLSASKSYVGDTKIHFLTGGVFTCNPNGLPNTWTTPLSTSMRIDNLNGGPHRIYIGASDGLLLSNVGSATVNEFSTDGTLAGNSDSAVPTEKATKTYIDANVRYDSTTHDLELGYGADTASNQQGLAIGYGAVVGAPYFIQLGESGDIPRNGGLVFRSQTVILESFRDGSTGFAEIDGNGNFQKSDLQSGSFLANFVCASWVSNATATVRYCKIKESVTLQIPAIQILTQNTGATTNPIYLTNIPNNLKSYDDCAGITNVLDLTTRKYGQWKFDVSSGNLVWTTDLNSTGFLGDGTNVAGFKEIAISWLSNIPPTPTKKLSIDEKEEIKENKENKDYISDLISKETIEELDNVRFNSDVKQLEDSFDSKNHMSVSICGEKMHIDLTESDLETINKLKQKHRK